jgi:tetratricopeptide (TPR) repeat protein
MKIRLSIVGLIIANLMAVGMMMSFYFIGRRVPPEFREEFSQAAGLQESGDLDEVIRRYQELHQRYGIESCNLYYNMGSAYYAVGQPGRALQFYMKARKLKPGDRHVRRNISYVEKKLNLDNSFPERERGLLRGYFYRVVGVYSIYGWTIFSVANYWRFCIGIILLIFFGSKRRFFVYLALILGIIFIVGLSFTGTRAWLDVTTRQGVAIESGVPAMYEHEDQGQIAFTLQEGQLVEILSEWRDWYEIRTNTAGRAWAKRSAIGEI